MKNLDTPKSHLYDDKLGYAPFAYDMARVIYDVNPTEHSCVIGICGKWGNGKTTFINFIKSFIRYSEKNNFDFHSDFTDELLKSVLEFEKKDELQNIKLERYYIDESAIFTTTAMFVLLLILYLSQHSFAFEFNLQLTLYIVLSFLGIFSIPKIKDLFFKLLNKLRYLLNYLYRVDNSTTNSNIEIIDFNPWLYRSNQNILENFLYTLANRININYKDELNIMFKYACAFTKINLENINCKDNLDINQLKHKIQYTLTNSKKKYLIVIDDLDRITYDEAKAIFKSVKLLADFPNIVYLIAYDKDKINPDNDNYIQKIVQFEQLVPIITQNRLKEIFIDRIENLFKNKNITINNKELLNYFDNGLYHYFTNIRDINRFENLLNIKLLDKNNLSELDINDFILISVLEEFDKKVYTSIQRNKNLLCNNIDTYNLTNHYNFLSGIIEHESFDIFRILFANYLKTLDTTINEIIQNQTSNELSDMSKDNLHKFLSKFRYKYLQFCKSDNYRCINNEKYFDNYFTSYVVKSILTTEEYSNLKQYINNLDKWENTYISIFSKNQDKFQDFIEQLKRDKNYIKDKNNINNLFGAFLHISDKKITELFNIQNYIEEIFSVILKNITPSDMLDILIENFSDSNIIQIMYWYSKLQLRNKDDYFKPSTSNKVNMQQLSHKIKSSHINIETLNEQNCINCLQILKIINLKPANFDDLKSFILTQASDTFITLIENNSQNTNYYKFYFTFQEIQDILINYYFRSLIQKNNKYVNDTTIKILNENITTVITNNDLQKISRNNNSCNNTINTIVNTQSVNINTQNILLRYLNNNLFDFINKLSDKNDNVRKYILYKAIKDTSTKDYLLSIFQNELKILNRLKEMDDAKTIKITNNLNSNIELQKKYEKILSDLIELSAN